MLESDEINQDNPESTIDTDLKDDTAGSKAIFDPQDLIGRTFLMDKQEDGQRFRARIVELMKDHDSDLTENPTRIKFLCKMNGDKAEEIITYNQMLDYISHDEENPVTWRYKRIASHSKPLKREDPEYHGSRYNVTVEWEDGSTTDEPLANLAKDDPVSCAIYARDNNLLHLDGWKQFKGIAKRQKNLTRMIKQAKLRSYNTSPKYMYGFEVPRDYKHAKQLDERNKNNRWQEAVDLELFQIDEYKTFEDLGHKDKVAAPEGYKKIRVHLIFTVKASGKFKARLVADGHLTEVPPGICILWCCQPTRLQTHPCTC